jgi:hypothetical protein
MVKLEFVIDNISGRTVALGLTHLLKEISTSRCVGWQPYHLEFVTDNLSGRVIVLGLTQILTEMNTSRCVGWQPYHLYVPTVSKSGSLILLEPLWHVLTLHRDCFIWSKRDRNFAETDWTVTNSRSRSRLVEANPPGMLSHPDLSGPSRKVKHGSNARLWKVEIPNIEFHELGASTVTIRH